MNIFFFLVIFVLHVFKLGKAMLLKINLSIFASLLVNDFL